MLKVTIFITLFLPCFEQLICVTSEKQKCLNKGQNYTTHAFSLEEALKSILIKDEESAVVIHLLDQEYVISSCGEINFQAGLLLNLTIESMPFSKISIEDSEFYFSPPMVAQIRNTFFFINGDKTGAKFSLFKSMSNLQASMLILENCSFSSDMRSSFTLFESQEHTIIIINSRLFKMYLSQMMYLDLGTVEIYETIFTDLILYVGFELKLNSNFFMENVTFSKIKVIFASIVIDSGSNLIMRNAYFSEFRAIDYMKHGSFIMVAGNGNKFNLTACTLYNISMANYFFYIFGDSSSFLFDQLNIENFDAMMQYSDRKRGLFYVISKSNEIILSSCNFLYFTLNYTKFHYITDQENILQITSSVYSNIKFLEDGSLISIKDFDCTIYLLKSLFEKFVSYDDLIKQDFTGDLVIKNCKFIDFQQNGNFGLISLYDSCNLILKSCIFRNISLKSYRSHRETYGGCLYAWVGNSISIEMCVFDSLKVTLDGASIYIEEENYLEFNSSNFTNNAIEGFDGSVISMFRWNIIQMHGQIRFSSEIYNIDFIHSYMGNIFETLGPCFFSLEGSSLRTFFFNSAAGINNRLKIKETSIFLNFSITNYQEELFNINYKNSILIINSKFNSLNKNLFFLLSNSENSINITNITVSDTGTGVFEFLTDEGSTIDIENCTISKKRVSELAYLERIIIILYGNAFISFKALVVENYFCHGIIFIKKGKQVTLVNSSFILNKAGNETSLVSIVESELVTMRSNLFDSNQNNFRGVVLITLGYSYVEITNNIFRNNVGLSDDAFFSKGGGIFINSTSDEIGQEMIIFKNNTFANNSADQGGALFIDIAFKDWLNSTFIEGNTYSDDNKGRFGNLFSSSLSSVVIRNIYESNSSIFKPQTNIFLIEGIDHFDNQVLLSDFSYSVTNKNQSVALFEVKFLERRNYLQFNYIDENNLSSLLANYNQTKILFINQSFELQIFTGSEQPLYTIAKINAKFQCESGEYFDPSTFSCKICEKNTMNLEKNIKKYCEPCALDKMKTCDGGNKTQLMDGYYLVNGTSEILRCKYPKACTESGCAKQYRRNSFLCTECEKDYGLTFSWECIECSRAFSYVSFIVFLFLQIFIKAYSVNKAYKLTKNVKKRKYNKEKKYNIFNLASTNSCLKILQIHMSFIFSLLSYPFRAFDNIGNTSASVWTNIISFSLENLKFSYECLSKDFKIPFYGSYTIVFIRILTPVIIIITWLIYFCIKVSLKKESNKKNSLSSNSLKRNTQITLISPEEKQFLIKALIKKLMETHSIEAIVLIAFTLSYEEVIFGLGHILFYFTTKEENGMIDRMLHDPVRRWKDEANGVYVPIVIIFILIFGLMVPLYIIARLTYEKKRRYFKKTKEKTTSMHPPDIQDSSIKNYKMFLKYGYFYYPYKKSYYYYEIVYMTKRVVYLAYNIYLIPLVSIHTKYENRITALVNLEILFLWLFFLIHSRSKPYRPELLKINSLETLSSIILLTSFFFSALFFNDLGTNEEANSGMKISNYLLYIGIYIANIFFLLYSLLLIYKNEKENILSMLSKLLWCFQRVWSKIVNVFKSNKASGSPPRFRTTFGREKTHFELNPLANWENAANKNLMNKKDNPTKEANTLLKRYKKKLKILKLLLKIQKKEIKKLNELLLDMTKKAGFNDFGQRSINEINYINCFTINNPSSKKKHDNKQSKPESDSFIENMQNELEDCEHPAKVTTSMKEIGNKHHNLGRDEDSFFNLDGQEFENNLNDKVLEDRIDRSLNINIIKSTKGWDHKSYFVKIKLVLFSQEAFEKFQFQSQETEDLFIYVKNKHLLPDSITPNELHQIVIFIKYLRKIAESSIGIKLFLKIKDKLIEKKLEIKLDDLDLLILNELKVESKDSGNRKKSSVKEFDHVIEKAQSQNIIKSEQIHALYKYIFPELFEEEEMVKIENSNQNNKRISIQKDSNWSEKVLLRKHGILHLIRHNLYTFMDFSIYADKIRFQFRDLHSPNVVFPNTNPEALKELLTKFIESRIL